MINASHLPLGLSSPRQNEDAVHPSYTYLKFEARRGVGTRKLVEEDEDKAAMI